ncbi:methyltransferase family protein [Murinocardiopsis flavida]|uniref:Methyltransferase family protein n=1 Tax=Murinocardiopsis flavida TaxID=645275 RepID=A0A2P8DTJ0_9ACTN|nr:class I SAM-dependent methyltransferase [Murinocardiopsis flavida]PSL00528.1 methyltransferase family protein [Murinocardiopsis flavida]
MISEMLVKTGRKLVDGYAPEGRDYWSARFWDRDEVERRPRLGDDLRRQKGILGSYIKEHAGDAERVVEFACGTGEFTAMAAKSTSATEILAIDISEHALDQARARVSHNGLVLRQGDFWNIDGVGTAQMVMCVDAIHHIGEVESVLRRLRSFVDDGGVLIGNLWTMDNYHDFQRSSHGKIPHFMRSSLFLLNAMVMKATGGRVRWASYRTQFMYSHEIKPMLSKIFSEVLAVEATEFHVAFACRK